MSEGRAREEVPCKDHSDFPKGHSGVGSGEGGREKPSAPFATQTVHLLLLLPRIFASGKERVGKNTAQWLKKKKIGAMIQMAENPL